MEGRVPDCYHFMPQDKELILAYLRKRIENKELHPKADFIKEVDIYKYHPLQLTEIFKDWVLDGNWYFFTPRERKYEKGMRPSRTAGNGTWKASGSDKIIEDEGQKIGEIKTLIYYNGNSKGKDAKTEWVKTEWVMKEYTDSLHPPRNPDGNKQLDGVVLCVIYKQKKYKAKRLKRVTTKTINVQSQETGDSEELPTPSTTT